MCFTVRMAVFTQMMSRVVYCNIAWKVKKTTENNVKGANKSIKLLSCWMFSTTVLRFKNTDAIGNV